MHANRRARIDATLIENEKKFDVKCMISKKLKVYKNMNDKNKIYKLSKHDSNDYIIEFNEKNQFSHDFIYFLFKIK